LVGHVPPSIVELGQWLFAAERNSDVKVDQLINGWVASKGLMPKKLYHVILKLKACPKWKVFLSHALRKHTP
jgi:hypothetical protein